MVRDMGLLVYSTQGGGGGGVGFFWIPASVGCESGNLIAHGKESRRLTVTVLLSQMIASTESILKWN